MGSDKFAYFELSGDQISSAELDEIAKEAGSADAGSQGQGQVVTRLDPLSRAKEGEQLEVWYNVRKLHIFDPSSGENVTTSAVAAAVPDPDQA